MSIVPILANAAFGPEELEILTTASDDAWNTVVRSGSTFAAPRYERAAREVIASRIVEMAKRGIMDRQRLCADAVAHLAETYREERA
jgi:hypothetical protein